MERRASGAAGSGRDESADAVRRRLLALLGSLRYLYPVASAGLPASWTSGT